MVAMQREFVPKCDDFRRALEQIGVQMTHMRASGVKRMISDIFF